MTRKFLILLILAALSHGLFEDNPNITPMSIQEQRTYFTETDFLIVSIVYNEGSDKAWHLSRTIPDLTDKLSNYVKFFSYDCTDDRELCPEDLLKDLPAVNLVIPNKSYKSSKDKVSEKPYVGTISAKEIGESITKEIPYLGEIIDASNLSEFLEEPEWNKAILFTNKESVPLIYKGISSKYRDRIGVGLVYSNSSEILEKYEVSEFPTLIVFGPEEPVRYKGRHEFKDLVRFLKDYVKSEKKIREIEESVEEVTKNQDEVKEENEVKEVQVEEPEPTKFIAVDSENFQKELQKSKKFTLVHFHKEENADEWDNIQFKLNGIVTLLDFSCLDNDHCESQGVNTFPHLRLYSEATKYSDISQTLSGLESQLFKSIKTEYSTITSKSVKETLSSAYLSGKVLSLFISKDSVPLSFKYLSSNPNLRNFVKFIHINADSNSVSTYFKLPRYPIVLTVFQTDLKRDLQSIDYSDNLEDYSKLLQFVEETSVKAFLRARPSVADEDLEDIWQVSETQTWNSKCLKKKGFCLVGFSDGNTEEKNKRLLKYVKTVMAARKVNFEVFVVDGGCFKEFREQFGVESLPGIALIQPENGKVWSFAEEVMEREVFDFVEGALLGKIEGKDSEKFEFVQGSCKAVGKKPKKHRIHSISIEDL